MGRPLARDSRLAFVDGQILTKTGSLPLLSAPWRPLFERAPPWVFLAFPLISRPV